MHPFKDYIWKHVKQGTIVSGAILCLLSIFLYSGAVYLLKNEQLNSSLKLASYTVEKSLEAGDWPLALGYLENLERSGFLYDIELGGNKNHPYQFSGPFGKKPVGVMSLCKSAFIKDGLKLGGCIRVFDITALFTLALFIFITCAMFFLVLKYFNARALFFIKKISDALKSIPRLNASTSAGQNPEKEEITEIASIRDYVLSLLKEVEATSEATALSQIGEQVAHDIKSPLAALDMIVYNCQTLSENERILLRKATSRISDISNNLLIGYDHKKRVIEHGEPEMISDLLSSILIEKRLQYNSLAIDWNVELDKKALGVFANVTSSDFKRIISNLINNAVESFNGQNHEGNIYICMNLLEPGMIQIRLVDNGCGIPSPLLEKIKEGGVSFGKEGGRGLGLKHAMSKIHSWGGSLHIESTETKGTTILINLKTAPSPNWFVSQLVIKNDGYVVVLDDDESIHHTWQEHFRANKRDTKVENFFQARDFIAWQQENKLTQLYLIDYELVGQNMNGLEVIRNLGISDKAFLVTSHYDNLNVRRECEQSSVKIIPKSFVPHVVIHCEQI